MNQPDVSVVVITPFYAALVALLFVALSFRTLLLRRQLGIAIGTGENEKMARAMRVHANFAEYVPLALLLIYFMEVLTDAGLWVHVLCIALIAGRLSHAYGVSNVVENYRFRVTGMVLTLGCLISAAGRLLISYATWGIA